MKMKRIIAGLLSFILIVSNPMIVMATEADTVDNTVSGNEVMLEMEEIIFEEENSDDTTVSGNSVSDNSVSENDITATEIADEPEDAEKTEEIGISPEYLELASEAKRELQEYIGEKDLYAIVYLTDFYPIKAEPDADADTVVSVPSARTVQVLGMEVEWEYQEEWEEYIPTVWYETQFYEGEILHRGYIEEENLAYSDELLLQWKNNWFMFFPKAQALYSMEGTYSASVSYTDVNQFPVSYRTALRKMKDAHPNWTFVPMNGNRNWSDCVSEQMGNYSWIYYNQPAEYRGAKINSTWYYASRAGIEYYMDPRNFLTESNIFQFEQNTYNASYHSVSALQSFLNNTFMKGKVPGDSSGRTYAQVIYNSGKSRGLSPFNLAARVIQEQGINGTSAMISGTYSGYEGYYNHYNISASGTTNAQVLRNGLSYAKKMGWNTRTKSLEGGAEFIGNGYILQGQDTLYLQKFDIENGSSSLHQYMQNIMAPYTEGRSMKTMYTNAGSLNSAFVFKIPVYKNMPSEYTFSLNKSSLTLQRGIDGKETYQLYVKCNGDKLTEGTITYKSDNSNVAKVDASTGLITAVAGGQTTIQVTVKFDGVEETLKCKVTVKVPLKEIFLNIEQQDLFLCDPLPDKIAYLAGDGDEAVTKYLNKEDGEILSEVVLEVTYNPIDTTDSKKVTWSVADGSIISLTKQGDNDSQALIKPLKAGTTTVTAKVGTCVKKAEITVRVPMMYAALKPNDIWEGIGNTLTLHTGETTLITASYEPHNTSDRIEPVWKSEDKTIVEIKDGRILAKKAGKTTLHAAIGPFDGIQDELSVDVVVEEYKVTFKDADGTTLLVAAGEYGKFLSNLTVEKDMTIPWDGTGVDGEGFFAGWYTAENGAGDAVNADTVLYGDMTLYPYLVAEDIAEFYIKPVGSITYTGAYIKPEVKVYNNNILLKKNVDYTVTYKNNKNVKDDADITSAPTITVKGKGTYAGLEASETFCIVPKNISHIDVTAKNVEAEYTGKIQKARPVITDAGRTLQRNVDYTLEYTDVSEGAYIEAGTYPVKIAGIGNYTGVRYAYITLTKRVMMEEVSISVPSGVKFNNGKTYISETEIEACRPAVTVKYAGKTLVEEVDYTLAYSDNIQIGTASVTVIGKGSYIGNRTVRFLITGTDIATTTVTGLSEREYTGEAIEIDNLTVVDKNKKTLTKDLDYTVSYKNNVKNGKASVIITGINGYSNQVIKTFTITPCNIAKSDNVQAELLSETYEYNKSGVKPEVTVSYKGEVLQAGTDYKVSYKNNNKVAGKNDENAPSVIITGKGTFTGEIVKTFDIIPKDIEDVSIKVKDVRYKNREGYCFVEPVLTDAGGRQLKAGVDYQKDNIYTYETDVVLTDGTIRYAGEEVLSTDIPTPGEWKDAAITVTVTGSGNYRGTISATYRILENTSWFDRLFAEEEEQPQSDIMDVKPEPVYPEIAATIQQAYAVGLSICEEAESETLVNVNDTTKDTPTQCQETKTSYDKTKEINNFDKQVIATNTIDFSDTKIAFLGDSITAGVGLEEIGVEENVYTTVVKRALNPEEVYRFGYGGYGMSYLGDSLLDKYENIPFDTDIIFVLAGTNDVYDGSEDEMGSLNDLSTGTFFGDTYKLMTSLQTRYPDAEIIFLTPLSTITNTWYQEMLPDMLPMERYVNAIKAIGEKTGVTVWDLYNENLLDSYDENVLAEYSVDGVHPGVAGHRVLGEHIASELIRMKMGE